MQEIVRDVPKEYRNVFIELINRKDFEKIPTAINELKLVAKYKKIRYY